MVETCSSACFDSCVMVGRYRVQISAVELSLHCFLHELLYYSSQGVNENLLRVHKTVSASRCGYGTIHDVNTKELEDRMESFFLSETCKYLYLVSLLIVCLSFCIFDLIKIELGQLSHFLCRRFAWIQHHMFVVYTVLNTTPHACGLYSLEYKLAWTQTMCLCWHSMHSGQKVYWNTCYPGRRLESR